MIGRPAPHTCRMPALKWMDRRVTCRRCGKRWVCRRWFEDYPVADTLAPYVATTTGLEWIEDHADD